MRLTLRNLLRFLDQTDLRSIERSRLEELVEQSEKADAWIKRIEALRRHPLVPAPSVDNDDPAINRVTTYLESRMSEEDIIDFERAMLSSDSMLAEIASCHEIRERLLTGERPPVPLLLRQSLYDLGRDVDYDQATPLPDGEDGHLTEDEVAALAASMEDLPYVDGGPDEPEPIGGFSDEPDEPDNETVSLDKLSRQARKKSRLVTFSLFAMLAALAGLAFGLGWLAGRQPQSIPGLEDPTDQVAKATAADGDRDSNSDRDSDSNRDNGSAARDESPADAKQPVADTPPRNPAEQASQPDAGFVALPQPPVPELDFPDSGEEDASELPPRPVIDAVRIGEAPPVAPAEPLVAVARIVDPETFLFQRDTAGNAWQRAAVEEMLLEQTRAMVLAGTAVELDFSGLVAVRIEGPARFRVGKRDPASGADVLEVDYGKLVVEALQEDVDLRVRSGQRLYQITFPLAESSLTADLTRYRPPGDDPRTSAVAKLDLLSVNSGRATIREGENTWLLSPPAWLVRSESENPQLVRPPAVGVPTETLPPPRYLTRLNDIVEKNPPASLFDRGGDLKSQLVNLKGNSRQEVRYAAMAWLASIGNYDYLVDFLNEDGNRANWLSMVGAVRASIAQDPDFANRLFHDLAVAGPEDQKKMFELILGMSPEQLAGGADARLVDLLDDSTLGVRVLAIETIRRITAGKTYGYTANAERKARRRIIERQWKRALKKEELRYPEPPALPVPGLSTVPGIDPPAGEADRTDSGTGG